jgi:hypothetical protein
LSGDERGHGSLSSHPRAPPSASRFSRADESAAYEVHQRIVEIDGGKPCYRGAAAGHDHLRALQDAVEVLAQSIVKIPHTDLVAEM